MISGRTERNKQASYDMILDHFYHSPGRTDAEFAVTLQMTEVSLDFCDRRGRPCVCDAVMYFGGFAFAACSLPKKTVTDKMICYRFVDSPSAVESESTNATVVK